MVLDFQQGIVTYPVDDGQQSFLNYSNGYYSLTATNGKTDVTFAHGTENYLHTESQTVPNAWGPLPPGTDCWLFWDINPQTGIRTFGFTTVQPVFSATQPTYAEDQHWFNTSDNRMRVGYQGRFIERIRVFAAKVNSAVITPLGSRYLTHPFAGSQVDLHTSNTIAGRIVTDSAGRPVRKANKTFFTTEDEVFVSGSPVNVIKLEASVVTATALEPLPKFHVVKYTDFGKVELASYNDTGTSTIAMVMEDLENGETGSICIQGVVTNPDWNWPFVGRELWITTAGVLTPVDPHIESPLTYVTSRVPVARVISPTSVIFDQGLGGKGDSTAGGGSATVGMATTDDAGILKISTPPSDPQNPIAVGTNDVRVTTALLKTGGAMTGDLVLANNPTANNHAANKQYVDSLVADSKLKVSQGGVLIQPDVTKMNFVGATVTASASGEVRVEVDEGNWIVEEFTVPGTPGSPATPDVTGDQLTVAHDVQSRVDRVYIPKQTVIDSDPIVTEVPPGWIAGITTDDSDLIIRSLVHNQSTNTVSTTYSPSSYISDYASESGSIAIHDRDLTDGTSVEATIYDRIQEANTSHELTLTQKGTLSVVQRYRNSVQNLGYRIEPTNWTQITLRWIDGADQALNWTNVIGDAVYTPESMEHTVELTAHAVDQSKSVYGIVRTHIKDPFEHPPSNPILYQGAEVVYDWRRVIVDWNEYSVIQSPLYQILETAGPADWETAPIGLAPGQYAFQLYDSSNYERYTVLGNETSFGTMQSIVSTLNAYMTANSIPSTASLTKEAVYLGGQTRNRYSIDLSGDVSIMNDLIDPMTYTASETLFKIGADGAMVWEESSVLPDAPIRTTDIITSEYTNQIITISRVYESAIYEYIGPDINRSELPVWIIRSFDTASGALQWERMRYVEGEGDVALHITDCKFRKVGTTTTVLLAGRAASPDRPWCAEVSAVDGSFVTPVLTYDHITGVESVKIAADSDGSVYMHCITEYTTTIVKLSPGLSEVIWQTGLQYIDQESTSISGCTSPLIVGDMITTSFNVHHGGMEA